MDIQTEKNFYSKYCNKEKYGDFHYLLGHFISDFKYLDTWYNELMPFFQSMKDKTGVINDWNSFDRKGEVCFRYEYILILDESIFQSGRKFPGLYDENKQQILNDEYQWLLDTEYLIENYNEFVFISIDEFINICKKWIELLKK